MSGRWAVTRGSRTVALCGHKASSFTLAWLATHRDRLRTLVLGGKRLSILIVWDEKGSEQVEHSDAEIDALAMIVRGEKVERS